MRRVASRLPGAVESDDEFGFYVEGKGKRRGFVWLWKERVAQGKARVPNASVVAIVTPSLSAKEVLLASDSAKYFTEPHYNGFPAVLVRLDAVDCEDIEFLVTEAWKSRAPKKAVALFEASEEGA